MNRVQAGMFAGTVFLFILLVVWAFTHPWFPELASDRATLDTFIRATLIITGIAFIFTHILLGWFAWKYRADAQTRAHYFPDNPRLEITWTAVTALILSILVFGALRLWARLYTPPPQDALVVEIVGQQFQWNIRYPGADGRFGRTDPKFISDQEYNFIGIDFDDPAAEDDICLQNQLFLEVNRPVHLQIRSRDVLHSFFVPPFRFKQDAVPGMTVHVWFTPTRVGKFEIACAEHCGLGHYRMRGFVYVLPSEEFRSMMTTLTIPASVLQQYPKDFQFDTLTLCTE